jgi:serine/threonine protein kinase
LLLSAVHKVNNYKGSIYMVCDYMDHDLTGLMERRNYKFTLPQVPQHICSSPLQGYLQRRCSCVTLCCNAGSCCPHKCSSALLLLPQIKCYMKQLLTGLAFCHKSNVSAAAMHQPLLMLADCSQADLGCRLQGIAASAGTTSRPRTNIAQHLIEY